MTIKLETLKNTSRPSKRRKLLGRGMGSKRGQTSARGNKGAGARSGWKARHGKVGGGVPLHRHLPTRGFSNARFATKLDHVNLGQIEQLYSDGETVSAETLRAKSFLRGKTAGVKVLAKGELTKKVHFQVEAFSEGAKEKLEKAGIAI